MKVRRFLYLMETPEKQSIIVFSREKNVELYNGIAERLEDDAILNKTIISIDLVNEEWPFLSLNV